MTKIPELVKLGVGDVDDSVDAQGSPALDDVDITSIILDDVGFVGTVEVSSVGLWVDVFAVDITIGSVDVVDTGKFVDGTVEAEVKADVDVTSTVLETVYTDVFFVWLAVDMTPRLELDVDTCDAVEDTVVPVPDDVALRVEGTLEDTLTVVEESGDDLVVDGGKLGIVEDVDEAYMVEDVSWFVGAEFVMWERRQSWLQKSVSQHIGHPETLVNSHCCKRVEYLSFPQTIVFIFVKNAVIFVTDVTDVTSLFLQFKRICKKLLWK